jgi:cytidine deaminase
VTGTPELTEDERVLIAAARSAMAQAHAPYSRYAVGAALRLTDGTIITGTNFENASYGLSLCAETVAVATANAQGRLRDIAAIAVTGGAMERPDATDVVTPCGRCRQILKESQDMGGREIQILCASADGRSALRLTVNALLPHAFGPANLGLPR